MANDLETIQVGQRFNTKDDVAFDTDLIEPEACKTLPGLFRMRAARAPQALNACKLWLYGFEQRRDAHAAGNAERRDAERGAGVFTARHAREQACDEH